MTAVERLVANGNSIIRLLKEFTVDSAKDVSITYINADGSESIRTFPNIAKMVNKMNITNENGIIKDLNGNSISEMFEVQDTDGGSSSISANNPLPFNTIISNDNNLITLQQNGKVTVSRAGIYILNVIIFTDIDAQGDGRHHFAKNGEIIQSFTANSMGADAVKLTAIAKLEAGDSVDFRCIFGDMNWYGSRNHNSFAGVRIC